MGTELATLTKAERSNLKACEQTIGTGLKTFRDVGQALLRIREERLYRDSHETFQVYCEQRWQFTRQRAHQLIDAAKTVEEVSTIVDIPNEAAARELKKVPESKREAVVEWAEEKADGKPLTAKAIKEAAAEVLEAEPEEEEEEEHECKGHATVVLNTTQPSPVSDVGLLYTSLDEWQSDHGKSGSVFRAILENYMTARSL